VLDDENVDDAPAPLISGREAIAEAIGGFDVVVKSPGISLYDPLVLRSKASGRKPRACNSPRCLICGLLTPGRAARSA